MPTRRRVEPRATAPLGLIAVGAAVALVLANGGGAGGGTVPEWAPARAAWTGLVGGPRPRVAVGQRVLVVLRAPSLADRVGASARPVTPAEERSWSSAALESQRRLIERLGLEGVPIRPEYRYTRVLDGFSAAIDARGVGLLEAAPEVAGVYPVRVAYPASSGASGAAAGAGGQPLVLPGRDGSGVTIALLDTGVDRTQPYLRGRVLSGYDVLRKRPGAAPGVKPDDQAVVESHGTQLAGVLVGAGGPDGASGVATGATVLPVRVAGWQPDASGHWSVYARSDEIVAGLERAVDRNGDGDAHDRARLALIGLAAPFAAFADDPVARAAAGAARLGTLVVAAAGNDGAAGPGYGSIAGPGGAEAALTVGAADLRATSDAVRLVVRAGLHVLLDTELSLAGSIAPLRPLGLLVAQARPVAGESAAPGIDAFFDRRGYSLVAGRAAFVSAGAAPRDVAEAAARAGAAAVLLDGARLPSGSLGIDGLVPVPVVGLDPATGRALRAALASGASVGVSIGPQRARPNPAYARVASFSSQGLAFDGRVKPDLVGPGVGVVTSAPGLNPDGSPRFETVSGTSVAAAAVAGAAALLLQSRPGLDAAALKDVLVGTAARLPGAAPTAQGGGLVALVAADGAEVAAEPASLALGPTSRQGTVVVRNLSGRPRTVRLSAGAALTVRPAELVLGAGASGRLVVTSAAGADSGEDAVRLAVDGGSTLRLPVALSAGSSSGRLISHLHLTSAVLDASALAPALLTLRLGRLVESSAGAGHVEVTPVARFDVELADAAGRPLGVLARIRDALPGTYAFALTGRAPSGARLAAGSYSLRLLAYPTEAGPPTRRTIRIAVR